MSAIRVVHASEINDPTVEVSEEPATSEEPAPVEEAAPSEEPAVPEEPAQQEPENQELVSNAIGEAPQTEMLSDATEASSDATESASDLMEPASDIANSGTSAIVSDIASTAQTAEEQKLAQGGSIMQKMLQAALIQLFLAVSKSWIQKEQERSQSHRHQ